MRKGCYFLQSYCRKCQPGTGPSQYIYSLLSLALVPSLNWISFPNYNAQLYGWRMRWLLGDSGAHSSPDGHHIPEVVAAGRIKAMSCGLTVGDWAPWAPSAVEEVTYNTKLKQQPHLPCCSSALITLLKLYWAAIHMADGYISFIDFSCLKLSHDVRHAKIHYIRTVYLQILFYDKKGGKERFFRLFLK